MKLEFLLLFQNSFNVVWVFGLFKLNHLLSKI